MLDLVLVLNSKSARGFQGENSLVTLFMKWVLFLEDNAIWPSLAQVLFLIVKYSISTNFQCI